MTVPAAPAAPASGTPAAPATPAVPPVPVPPATPAPSPTPGTPEPNSFKVPEKYAKEPWASGIKSNDDLFDQFHNAQGLLGKKGVILPGDKATPDEVKAFHKAIGVPESVEGYEFKVIDALKDRPRDSKIDNMVKQRLQKHGIPKAAGEQLIADMEQMVFDLNKPQLEAQAKIEKDFSALKLATFGDKAETAQAQFEEVMTETLGKENLHLQTMLKTLPAEARTVTIAFAKAIHDKYVGEHKINPPAGGGGGQSPDLQTAFNELSSAKAAVRADKDMPQHVKNERIAELNKKMQAVGAKAKEAGIDLFAKK